MPAVTEIFRNRAAAKSELFSSIVALGYSENMLKQLYESLNKRKTSLRE
ncbi:hypothetical protein SDJN02_05754, partial [Cucurbita argyrosperma subsp. argyrosperma]